MSDMFYHIARVEYKGIVVSEKIYLRVFFAKKFSLGAIFVYLRCVDGAFLCLLSIDYFI